MPKCPYCENEVKLEDLEVQGTKFKKKIPGFSKMTAKVTRLAAVLCPKCNSILNVELYFHN